MRSQYGYRFPLSLHTLNVLEHEFFIGKVAFIRGNRRHARSAVGLSTLEDHRVRRVAGDDDFGGGVSPVGDEFAIEEARGGSGRAGARVPESLHHAAGLMALDAVGGEIGTNAPFEGGGSVIRFGIGAE